MKVQLMTLTAITVLVLMIRSSVSVFVSVSSSAFFASPTTSATASSDDHQPLFTMSMAGINQELSFKKLLLGVDESETVAEASGHPIQSFKEQMEKLGGEKTCLLSRYNDLNRGLNICKIGMEHHDDESAANQTLLVQQVEDRKELLFTILALSQVYTKILDLVEKNIKLQGGLMQLKLDFPKQHQDIIQLRSKLRYLQSLGHHQILVEDEFACVASSSNFVGSSANACVYNNENDPYVSSVDDEYIHTRRRRSLCGYGI